MSGRCVTLHVLKATRQVKRIGREPVVRRTTRFVERHVVKSSVAAFMPTIVNDTLFHHQAITTDAIIHIVSDDVSVSSIMALVSILMRFVP